MNEFSKYIYSLSTLLKQHLKIKLKNDYPLFTGNVKNMIENLIGKKTKPKQNKTWEWVTCCLWITANGFEHEMGKTQGFVFVGALLLLYICVCSIYKYIV